MAPRYRSIFLSSIIGLGNLTWRVVSPGAVRLNYAPANQSITMVCLVKRLDSLKAWRTLTCSSNATIRSSILDRKFDPCLISTMQSKPSNLSLTGLDGSSLILAQFWRQVSRSTSSSPKGHVRWARAFIHDIRR